MDAQQTCRIRGRLVAGADGLDEFGPLHRRALEPRAGPRHPHQPLQQPVQFRAIRAPEETRRDDLRGRLAGLGPVPFGQWDNQPFGAPRREWPAAATGARKSPLRWRRRCGPSRVLLRAARVGERLRLSAGARARQAAHGDLIAGLASETGRALPGLLEAVSATARSGGARLRDRSSAASAVNLVLLAGLLTEGRVLGVEPDRARRIHPPPDRFQRVHGQAARLRVHRRAPEFKTHLDEVEHIAALGA